MSAQLTHWLAIRQRTVLSRYLLLTLSIVILCGVAACGGDEGSAAEEPTPAADAEPTAPPDPAAIMSEAAEVMTDLESAAFEITRNGGAAYIDSGQTLNFNSASGVFSAPSSIDGDMAVLASGAALSIRFISVSGNQYITNPLNQQWGRLPDDWGFDPAALFDPATGWLPLLQQDISEAELLEISSFGGTSRYRITATANGERVEAILGGIAGKDAVEVEFFVDTETFEIVQMSFMTDSSEDEPAEWLLRFFDFNEPVSVTEPTVEE